MKIRHYLLLGGVALVLTGSFFLPNAVAGVTDGRRLDNLTVIDSQSISFEAAPELNMFGRIALVANMNTEVLPLKTGNAMDYDEASEKVCQELERFSKNGAWKLDYSKYSLEDGAAALVIDTFFPARSLIVWEMTLADPAGSTIAVVLDDETGSILRLVQKWASASESPVATGARKSADEELYAAAENLTEMMTEYYGFYVALADYQFSDSLSYYKAEIFDGGLIIPMYGVVRATGFTMNERA